MLLERNALHLERIQVKGIALMVQPGWIVPNNTFGKWV
jgi:hypothetical protein